jgi:hypothetical protein
MKRKSLNFINFKKKQWFVLALTASFTLIEFSVKAQDGNAGINDANTKVRSYFQSGSNLMYAVGAILGLIGAVKVYQKWNAGDQDTGKVAAAWFGSCVFLVVVVTVIKAFFAI